MVHTMSKQDSRADRSRRVHSAAFKQDLIVRSLVPGASVSALALQAGINANLLFKWRREHLRSQRGAAASVTMAPTLLPVTLAAPSPAVAAVSARNGAFNGTGSIEIDIDGARVRLRGVVDEAALRSVLHVLRQRA
jgi:transposase